MHGVGDRAKGIKHLRPVLLSTATSASRFPSGRFERILLSEIYVIVFGTCVDFRSAFLNHNLVKFQTNETKIVEPPKMPQSKDAVF